MSVAPRTALLVFLGIFAGALAFSGEALAQDEAEAPAAEEAAAPLTERVYAADTLDLRRWADDEVSVKTVAKGTELQVVLRDGDDVRVLTGTSIGWASAEQLLDSPPADDATSVIGLGGPPSLGLGGSPSLGLGGGLGASPPTLSPPPSTGGQ